MSVLTNYVITRTDRHTLTQLYIHKNIAQQTSKRDDNKKWKQHDPDREKEK